MMFVRNDQRLSTLRRPTVTRNRLSGLASNSACAPQRNSA
jgi:hypothetical protein